MTEPAAPSTVEDEHPAPGWARRLQGPPERREARAFAAMCGGSLAFSAWFVWRSSFRIGGWLAFALFDDAMISMRYARNLAAGDGLVWNAHGERVEGITNPLWTLWMALLHLLPVHVLKISLLVMASGALAVVATLWVVRRLARHLAPGDDAVTMTSVALTATFFPLVFWSVSGMEVGVLACLVGVLALYALRLPAASGPERRHALVVLAAAGVGAVGLRLDAAVPVALAAGYAAWRSPAGRRLLTAALAGGPPLAALAAMTVARRAYYGDWLPNTYYLKATGTPLADRLGTGLSTLGNVVAAHVALLVLAAAVAVAHGGPARWFLASLIAGQVGYSVWVGGDAWELLSFANRYLTVAVVPLAVLAALGIRRAAATPRASAGFCAAAGALGLGRWLRFGQVANGPRLTSSTAVLVVGLVAAAAGVMVMVRSRGSQRPAAVVRTVAALTVLVVVFSNLHAVANWWRSPAFNEQQLAREGWAIAHSTDPDAVVAVWLAGAEPYFADRPAVDLYGKSDRHIAHMPQVSEEFRPGHTKGDLDWSLRTYRPDLVQMPGGARDDRSEDILRARGYEPATGTLWVRSDSDRVDLVALSWALYLGAS